MLDFARELFLRLAPNNTGWCDTLESFLNSRKYKLHTRVRQMKPSAYASITILYAG